MLAVLKRELDSYYYSAIGYVFMGCFLLIAGIFFTFGNIMSASSSVGTLFSNITFIFILIVPILTMKLMSDERKSKTDQLLLTSPVSIPGIVLGKFLAEVVVFALPLTVAVIMPLILTAFGTVSLVSAFSALFAYLLLGAACLAVGTWISALTENQIIAYLATFGALLIAYLMNGIKSLFTSGNMLAFIVFCVVLAVVALLVGLACKNVTVGSAVFCGGAVVLVLLFKLRPAWLLTGFNSVLGALALFQPFTDFVGGMFSVTGIVYYLSVAGLFLFLTGQALERRRWN